MKQLELDYQAHNYTDTSKSAWANKKDKLTKREQVFEYIKLVISIILEADMTILLGIKIFN